MTLDDLIAREGIRATMAKYNTSGDSLRVDAFAECFCEDGIIQSERAPGDYIFRYEGRENIRAWQNRWLTREPGADTVHKASFVRHHLSTCHIELTGPTTAKARTYWAAWTDIGPDHAGVYMDEFRKEGDDWLIALRRVRRDWNSADGLFVTAIENTKG